MNNETTLLTLIRLGIGHPTCVEADVVDWSALYDLAADQSVAAVVFDGYESLLTEGKLPQGMEMTLPMKMMWLGLTAQFYEDSYNLSKKVIGEMAKFYNEHGYKMMVLKGFACGLNWPRPEHRPAGDIDIWQFGEYKKADALLALEKGIKVDNSHHHHTVFSWQDVMVENHYDFINVHHHKSNVELEMEFKRLGQDDSHYVLLDGEKVYLPSPNLHALFLLKHTMNDFTAFSMTLRQVLDWAFHIEKHSKEIDWVWLNGLVVKYHMSDFFNCLCSICVEDLGFAPDLFPEFQCDLVLKKRVLSDILQPEFTVDEPPHLLPRLIYKFRRWKGNAWKHRLCYNESLWSAFWTGIWAHIIKPSSI